jgi:phosphohistidine phosphatase
MNLYLLRHGIAVTADEPGIETDGQRPLSNKGVKRMRKAARGLQHLQIPFDGILTSPLVRARQTAEIVADALDLQQQIQELSGLAPESSVDHLVFSLTRFQNREHLLLVGHQPLLGDFFSFLLKGKDGPDIKAELKKGGLCRIEVETFPPAGPGSLHWLLTPKQLRLMGGRSVKL